MKQELELKTRRSILLGCSSGQAVVEYILIVSIAVGLIVIMKGAFKGMSTFIDNYLGSYTECLMTHGELPTLGVGSGADQTFHDSSGLKEHLSGGYSCDGKFKKFTIEGGRPPIANGNASDQASKNSSGGKNGSNSENSSGSGGSGSSSKDRDSDKDKVGRNGSGSGSSPYEDGNIRRSGRRSADGIANGGDGRTRFLDEEGGDEEGSGGRRRKPRESRIIYKDNTRYRSILGNEAEQLVKQSSRSTVKRKPTTTSIARSDSGGDAPGPRSGLMKEAPAKRVIAEEATEEGWGFGKMLKWLLIIGIIVAIVIFFGGQLLNYSNSDS